MTAAPQNEKMLSLRWLKLNFAYFVLVALLGVTMRSAVLGIDILPYNHLLHTHSHIAFLGWVYPTLYILLVNRFLSAAQITRYRFKIQLILTHLLIFLMLIAFLAQGYAFYSILFSSLFQILNYVFVISFWRALKNRQKTISDLFLKVALASLAVSTFGPWAVGTIKANGLGNTPYYKMAIYFYLHFQYNGWIIFALLALFFKQIEGLAGNISNQVTRFFILFAVALVPDYALSLLGLFNLNGLTGLAWLAAIFQLIALFYFLPVIKHIRRNQTPTVDIWSGIPLFIAGLALILKILLQFFPLFHSFRNIAFNNRGVVIAFIHLVMLGVISSYLMSELLIARIIDPLKKRVHAGIISFFIGFSISELLLAFQFIYIPPFYYTSLFLFTLLMFAGLLLLFSGAFTNQR